MTTYMYCNIPGMLSKSCGQVLCLAAVFSILFSKGNDEPPIDDVPDTAVRAAINFVKVTCQQTAYIAGRGYSDLEVVIVIVSTYVHEVCVCTWCMCMRRQNHELCAYVLA